MIEGFNDSTMNDNAGAGLAPAPFPRRRRRGVSHTPVSVVANHPLPVVASSLPVIASSLSVIASGAKQSGEKTCWIASGYAVQEVKAGELTQAGQLNLTGSLTGKVAGAQVNSFGGTVGASSRIIIRGNSSFAENRQPLLVVDGVPIANDTQRSGDHHYEGIDYGSGMNDINHEDIESLTALKGGAAALYGMRAGRGVILITTMAR